MQKCLIVSAILGVLGLVACIGSGEPYLAGDGLLYTANDGDAGYSLSGGRYASGALTIPATFRGRSVSRIGVNAFANNSRLTEVTVPAGIVWIEQYAFFRCSQLQLVRLMGSEPPTLGTNPGGLAPDSVFVGCSSLTRIIVPSGSLGMYAATNGWSLLAHLMEESAPGTTVSSSASTSSSDQASTSASMSSEAGSTGVSMSSSSSVESASSEASSASSLSSSSSSVDPLAGIAWRELVSVAGGTWTQQDTEVAPSSFIHTIQGFRLGRYEVTYELWYAVRQWALANGYLLSSDGSEGHNGVYGAVPTEDRFEPVSSINWRDAIVWCNAYSQMSGLTPVYCSDVAMLTPIKNSTTVAYEMSIDTTPGSFDYPYVKWDADGYRLPTEGEWQYAASYGAAYNYASGAAADWNNAAETALVAWYLDNAGGVTRPVGGRNANALGIHDLSGNVQEWCWDWSGTWPGTGQTDYRGPSSGGERVRRGGHFNSDASSIVAGKRGSNFPYGGGNTYGLRVARRM